MAAVDKPDKIICDSSLIMPFRERMEQLKLPQDSRNFQLSGVTGVTHPRLEDTAALHWLQLRTLCEDQVKQFLRNRLDQELCHRLTSLAAQLVPWCMQCDIILEAIATNIQGEFFRQASTICRSSAAAHNLPLDIDRSNHSKQSGISARGAACPTDRQHIPQHAVSQGLRIPLEHRGHVELHRSGSHRASRYARFPDLRNEADRKHPYYNAEHKSLDETGELGQRTAKETDTSQLQLITRHIHLTYPQPTRTRHESNASSKLLTPTS